MVVTIEKYFEIYVVQSSVVEYKNNVRTFRNTQSYLFFFLCFFNIFYMINLVLLWILLTLATAVYCYIYFDLMWIGMWRQFNIMLNALCECEIDFSFISSSLCKKKSVWFLTKVLLYIDLQNNVKANLSW